MPLRNMLGVGCRILGLVCLVMAVESALGALGLLFFLDSSAIPFRILALQTASAIVSLGLLIVVGLHLLRGGPIVQRLEFGAGAEPPSREAEDLFVVLMKLYGLYVIASGLGAILSNAKVLGQTVASWLQGTAGAGGAAWWVSAVIVWCAVVVAVGFYLLMGGALVRRVAYGRPGESSATER